MSAWCDNWDGDEAAGRGGGMKKNYFLSRGCSLLHEMPLVKHQNLSSRSSSAAASGEHALLSGAAIHTFSPLICRSARPSGRIFSASGAAAARLQNSFSVPSSIQRRFLPTTTAAAAPPTTAGRSCRSRLSGSGHSRQPTLGRRADLMQPRSSAPAL